MTEDYFTHTEADAGRYEAGRGDPPDDAPTRAELDAEDLPYEPVPHFVCEECLDVVSGVHALTFGAVVVCHACATGEDPWTAQEVRPR